MVNRVEFRVALLRAGLTQQEIAAQLGYQPQALSRYLGGHRTPPADLISRLAAILGVSVAVLTGSATP